MSENVRVKRLEALFGAIDAKDATAYADAIMLNVLRVTDPADLSVPSGRLLNLAMAYSNLRYPFQCCGKHLDANQDTRCPDCPMRAYDTQPNPEILREMAAK